MSHRLFSRTTIPFLAHILAFLIGASFSSVSHAQDFQPAPVIAPCSVVAEGRGLYISGGNLNKPSEMVGTVQTFMIDLSISWDTNNPVFKQLSDGPGVVFSQCSLLSNGEEMFVLVMGNGYIYNLKSNSWRIFPDKYLPVAYARSSVVDPETGLIYIPDSPDPFGLNIRMLREVNLTSKTVTLSEMPAYDTFFAGTSAWNVLMKSMIFITGNRPTIQTFTPSKVNGTFNGWGTLNITDNMLGDKFMPCLTSIQGGSKMVLFGGDTIESSVYILDMATLTWTKSSPVPTTFSACGVAGDQVIVWGGAYNYTLTGKTHVYNMKTEKWVSTYTAPSTTLQQPTQHDTTTATDSPDSDKSSSNDTKLVIIISVTIAVVLAVMVTAMILFLRRTRRLNSGDIKSTTSNNPSSGSLETMYEVNVHDKVPSDTLAHSRDPAYSDLSAAVAQDPHTEMKQNVWSQMGRLHEGSAGALLDPAHPHAVVQEEETKRNVQMGSFGARPVSQHPHACPDMKTIATYNNDKAELDEPHAYSDKTIAATYNSDKAELDEWKK